MGSPCWLIRALWGKWRAKWAVEIQIRHRVTAPILELEGVLRAKQKHQGASDTQEISGAMPRDPKPLGLEETL